MSRPCLQAGLCSAKSGRRQIAHCLRGRFSKLGSFLVEAGAEVLNSMGFPIDRTFPIPLSGYTKEAKPRENDLGILPSDAGIVRLIGTRVVEQAGNYTT